MDNPPSQIERTLAELRKSEARLKEAQRIAKLGSWELDLITGELAWSDQIFRIFELDENHFGASYEAFLNAIHPEDRAQVDAAYTASLSTRTPYEIVHRLQTPDGRIKWVQERCETFYDADGKALRSIGTVQDITERKTAQLEITRTRDLLRTVIDSSHDWIFVQDEEHRFVLVNEAYAQAQGQRPEAMLARPDTDFWSHALCEGDPERGLRGFRQDDRDVLAGQLVRNRDDVAILSDGKSHTFETYKSPLRDEHGRIYGVLGYSRDVTEQRDLAVAQRRSLEENEVLLREIHHRVKNNLQIISSLLHFHMKKARLPQEASVLEEVRKRLFAMILVHEKLFRSKKLASVELGDYARSLTGTLVQSFEGRGRISFEVVSDDVQLPIEIALPAGMILCELVTNVFKYAFPGERGGRAIVRVQRSADRVLMRVDDDGVGLPEGFDPHEAESFGFHLVRSLVGQLDGTLTASSDHGAHLSVAFRIPEARRAL